MFCFIISCSRLPRRTPLSSVWILFTVPALWTGSSTDLTIDSILLDQQIDWGKNKNRKACVVGKERERLPDSPGSGLRCDRAGCHTPWPPCHSWPRWSLAGRCRCSCPGLCSYTWPRWHRVCGGCSSSDLRTNRWRHYFICSTSIAFSFLAEWRKRQLHTLVTKDASPAFLAGALPRLFTGTMFTGWMELTHITKEALPALSASAHT